MRPSRAAIVVALALILAACGSDDTSTDGAAAEDDPTTESTEPDEGDGAEADTREDATAEGDDDAASDADDAGTEGAGSDEAAMSDDDAASDDEDGSGGGDTPRAGPSQTADLAIVSIDFSTAAVELTNTTDADLDINGWVMCNFPSYAPISGVDPIAAGETITITSTVAIPANDGELAIYTAEDFTNPDSIVTYVEWGSDGHTRAKVATAAGIWDGPALVPDGDILTIAG